MQGSGRERASEIEIISHYFPAHDIWVFSQHTIEIATAKIIGKNLNKSLSYLFPWPTLNIITHTQIDHILQTLQSYFHPPYMESFSSYFKKPDIITDDLQITAMGVWMAFTKMK